MQASELRIGNLILFSPSWKSSPIEPRVVKVKRIYEKSCIVLDMGLDLEVAYNSEETQPIALTEEWLFKLGYEPHPTRENNFIKNGHIIWKCNDLFLCDKNGVILKHVHQLQNFFFALKNKELETTP